MREFRLIVAFSLAVFCAAPRAMAQSSDAPQQTTEDPSSSICAMIESAARVNTLPVDFFVRLIWQESRFRPDEIGPLTRSGQRALGIAQFMPGTAIERQLYEPFNPAAALPKSGEFLAELRNEFGNLGLAAAAYNAGPQRLRDYLAGLSHDLPLETRNYVLAITGRPVEDWAASGKDADVVKTASSQANNTPVNCRELLVRLDTPNRVSVQWQERNVPSWCRALQHPNLGVCGPVHSRPSVTMALGQPKPRSHVHLIKASLR